VGVSFITETQGWWIVGELGAVALVAVLGWLRIGR
jgi:hypothetical protein